LDKTLDILNALANEKGLKFEDVVEAFKIALLKTAQKMLGDVNIVVNFDKENKKLHVYQVAEVVDNKDDKDERALDNENFIYLDEAHDIDPNLKVGDKVEFELDFEKLGRAGAANLQRELDFQILRLMEKEIYEKYKNKIGELITGVVVRVDKDENTYIEIGEVKGVLPKRNRIKGESFKVGDILKAVIKYVNMDKNKGITIEISRTTPKFLEELIKLAVPEVKEGLIKIHSIARIPGVRAKVAVSALSPNIDAIGTIIGSKGVRINSISRELNNENIDVIEYNAAPELFVARALSPAIVDKVTIEEAKNEDEMPVAKVLIRVDQKAKAIGKNGINITLASMLTKYKIEFIEKEDQEPKKDAKDFDKLFNF
jgi:N utilization substance protein A